MTCGGAAGLRPLRPSPLSWHWHSRGYLHSSRDNKSPESERRRSRLRPRYGGRRRPSERRLVEVIWPWAIKEACSFEVSRSLPSTAAATQLVHRKTGSRRWRSNSLITVVAFVFFFVFFLIFFFLKCVHVFFYSGVSGHHRGQRRLDQKWNLRLKQTKQNVRHHATLECRSRTEKV